MKYFMFLLFAFTFFSCENKPQTTENQENTQNTANPIAQAAEVNHDCLYCGMPSQEFPRSQAKAERQTGAEVWFCSPRCYFALRSEAKPDTAFTKVWVTEFYELKKIEAQTAWYVTGSDVMGAMGHDFIPLASEKDAQNFQKEHQGKRIWKYAEINTQTLKEALKN